MDISLDMSSSFLVSWVWQTYTILFIPHLVKPIVSITDARRGAAGGHVRDPYWCTGDAANANVTAQLVCCHAEEDALRYLSVTRDICCRPVTRVRVTGRPACRCLVPNSDSGETGCISFYAPTRSCTQFRYAAAEG